MTKAGGGPPRRYRVDYLPPVKDALPGLLRDAAAAGIKAEFTDALVQMETRLRTDPFAVGELVRQVPLLHLLVHVGSCPSLTMRFGIHETEPVVFVIEIMLRPDSL
jgi:hypothetical protein